jgi:hypothetical protein
MAETKIGISELKSEGGDTIKDLAEFLKERTMAEVETVTDEIIVKGEGKAVSKPYLRVLLRRFLYQNELKDDYRVIGGKENSLMIKARKIYEEE